MARQRTGSLEFRGKTWHVRLTVTVDGESVRKRFDLGTDNRAVARRKRDRLIREFAEAAGVQVEAVDQQAERPETFAEAAARIVEQQGREGLKTWRERLSRLEHYALPALGKLEPKAIRPAHIRDVLTAAGESLSKQSVIHVRNDLGAVLGDLWRDEQIPSNPVKRVQLPKNLQHDTRPRIILSDEEFAAFMAAEGVPEHVHLMALASRSFGGMRTSDLHAWDWSHVDVTTWESAEVYRPKTDGPDAPVQLERLAIPGVLRAPLQAWWTRWSRPTSGPVFPILKGKRAGQRQGKRSHARELRHYLWQSGVHRPLEGFSEALARLQRAESRLGQLRAAKAAGEIRQAQWDRQTALEAAQALDALQTDTQRTRAVDFHSFRRAFNTALGAAGVNVQQAMSLAGHRDPRTHLRYVNLAQRGVLETPAAALPQLQSSQGWAKSAGAGVNEDLESASFLLRPQRDSNPCYRRERRPESSQNSIKTAESVSEGVLDGHDKTAGNAIVGQMVWANSAPEVAPESERPAEASDPVDASLAKAEADLAAAIVLMAQAGQFEAVAALTRELAERRRARTAPEVPSLEAERAKRGGRS